MIPSRDDLIDFIYAEARMLDEGRFTEWLDLWMPDGIYWMPLDYKQTDPDCVTSLLYEDQFMLRLRVERLNGARTFSQKPKSRCHHVIQRPFVDLHDPDANRYVTNTAMHYVETRLDDQFLLALTATHDLTVVDGALRIAGKTADYYSTAAASIGLQLGAQAKTVIILFLEKAALDKFRNSKGWEAGVDGSVALIQVGAGGSIDTTNIKDPIIGFVIGQKGLMFNVTLEGSKFTKLVRE